MALRAALGRRAKSLPPPPGERCEGRGEATTPSSGHGPLPAQGQLLLSGGLVAVWEGDEVGEIWIWIYKSGEYTYNI